MKKIALLLLAALLCCTLAACGDNADNPAQGGAPVDGSGSGTGGDYFVWN